MKHTLRKERGSAMVEAAILFPCLVLIVMWSSAMTDIMVLKLKSAEAARFSLWETAAMRSPAEIDRDMQARFADLRSPAAIRTDHTGLMMYPLASNIAWKANVTTDHRVSLGNFHAPDLTNPLQRFIGAIASVVARTIDGELARERFNTRGKAEVRVTLVRATHDERASSILKGGDLLGLRGGTDLDHSKLMTNYTFQTPLASEKPMQLVFDTWKAWPKPAAFTTDGGPTNVGVSPMQTYPTVEKQVSAQVEKIAFFGLKRQRWFNSINNVLTFLTSNGVSTFLLGGHLPDVFSTELMDGPKHGPITILPPEPANAGYVPNRCSGGACSSQRLGDLFADGGPRQLSAIDVMSDGVDRTRYTIPYKINTDYWRESGGTNSPESTDARMSNADGRMKQQNQYVRTYQCRGHYFLGSTRAREYGASRRYKASCYR